MVQVALHPSPSVLFLSSQTSPGSMMPLPQVLLREQAPWGGHVQFGSMWQAPLQPSPATVLPSSHCSMPPWLLIPSPQPGGTGNCTPLPPVPVVVVPPVPVVVVPPAPTTPPLPPPLPPVPFDSWTPAW